MRNLRLEVVALCSLHFALSGCGSSVSCGPGTHLEGGVCLADPIDGGREADAGPIDASTPDAAMADAGCHACEIAVTAVCDGQRVLRCVTLADGCTALSLEQTCSDAFECRDGACHLRPIEPAGFTVPTPPDPNPEDLIWDGTEGIVAYHYATTDARDGATFRFDASGPTRDPHRTSIGTQDIQLATFGARTFVYERVAPDLRTGVQWYTLGELAADGTVSMLVRHDVCSGTGSARLAYAVDASAILFTRGASCAPELYTPGGAARPLGLSATYWFYGTSVLPLDAGAGFALLWIASGAAAFDVQRFGSDGTAIGSPVSSPVDLYGVAAPLDAFVALPSGGYFAIWAQYDPPDADPREYHMHSAIFDASGARTSERVLDTTVQVDGDFPPYVAGVLPSGALLLGVPQPSPSSHHPLYLLQVATDGTVLDETLVSGPGGVARYANGSLAICRASVSPEPDAIRCSVSAL